MTNQPAADGIRPPPPRCPKRRPATPDELPDSLTSDLTSWSTAPGLFSVDQVTADGLRLILQKARFFMLAAAAEASPVANAGDTTASTSSSNKTLLERYVLSTVSYEKLSDGTDASFESAFANLGGGVLRIDASGKGGGNTSAKKGETLADTLSCMECYSDITVLRHPNVDSFGGAVRRARKPVIAAGGSAGQHPTRALRDVFTVFNELGLLGDGASGAKSGKDKPMVVVLSGDLINERSGHEFVKLLARSGNAITLRYRPAPTTPDSSMPQDVRDYLGRYENITEEVYASDKLEEAVDGGDVLYDLGVKNEVSSSTATAAAATGMFVLSPDPRATDRAVNGRQVENGVYIRMALFALILGKA